MVSKTRWYPEQKVCYRGDAQVDVRVNIQARARIPFGYHV